MTQSGIDDRFRRRANLFTFLFDVQARRTAHSDTRGCVCVCVSACCDAWNLMAEIYGGFYSGNSDFGPRDTFRDLLAPSALILTD